MHQATGKGANTRKGLGGITGDSQQQGQGGSRLLGGQGQCLLQFYLANRDLIYLGVSGDGDSASIGLGQFAHAARRNLNMLYIIENNGVINRLLNGEVAPAVPPDLGPEAKRVTEVAISEGPVEPAVVDDLLRPDRIVIGCDEDDEFVGYEARDTRTSLLLGSGNVVINAGWKFAVLAHNTIRGAAGGSLLNAELLVTQGYLGSEAEAIARSTS